MAVKKPLVLSSTSGLPEQLQAGDSISGVAGGNATAELTPNADMDPGCPVNVNSPDACRKAVADPGAYACHGLAAEALASGVAGSIIFSGILTLTTGQWDDVVVGASGGLDAGTRYYLDAAAPGMLTDTPPDGTGEIVQVIGTALSTTDMLLQIGQPTVL